MDVSVIIPCCNEYPQVLFTVQSVVEELEHTGYEYEILVVSNRSTDKTNEYFTGLKSSLTRNGRLRFFAYEDRLSHWQAKNLGVSEASGRHLFFLDAHCILGRDTMKHLIEFADGFEGRLGGVHCLIRYMLDPHLLEYAVKDRLQYRFCSANGHTEPYEVPVMSTCGMLVPRSTFDEVGAWSPELGIYGGGEAYINWKMTTCGYEQWNHPQAICWHYADKRGYSWNYNDFVRNSFIAAYVVAGEDELEQEARNRLDYKKDRPEVILPMRDDVMEKCKSDRDFVASRQVTTLDAVLKQWESRK